MKSHTHQISNCLHLEVSRSRHRFSGSCAQVAVVQPLKLCPRLMLLTAKRDVSLPSNSVLIKNFLHLYVVVKKMGVVLQSRNESFLALSHPRLVRTPLVSAPHLYLAVSSLLCCLNSASCLTSSRTFDRSFSPRPSPPFETLPSPKYLSCSSFHLFGRPSTAETFVKTPTR
jgi:hypothetical protein